MRREIYTYGQKILRNKAKQVDNIDDGIKKIVSDMLETMYAENGVGLAAEQVGIDLSICVIDIPAEYDLDTEKNRLNEHITMPLVMINPEIIEKSAQVEVLDEGCLSFPGVYAQITRHSWVKVRYVDLNNIQHEGVIKGYLSRAVQHEIDHLLGVLFVDRITAAQLVDLNNSLKQLKLEGEKKDIKKDSKEN